MFGSFFTCQKNVCESVLHPVNLFVSCKYLLAAYMIKWQPTTVCKHFSQGISRDHYSSHYLRVWEPAGLQGDDASPQLNETCITCNVTYASSKRWRKNTSFPYSILNHFCYSMVICYNWHSNSAVRVPELIWPPQQPSPREELTWQTSNLSWVGGFKWINYTISLYLQRFDHFQFFILLAENLCEWKILLW